MQPPKKLGLGIDGYLAAIAQKRGDTRDPSGFGQVEAVVERIDNRWLRKIDAIPAQAIRIIENFKHRRVIGQVAEDSIGALLEIMRHANAFRRGVSAAVIEAGER